MSKKEKNPAREKLIANLNEDLSREYQAIIAYVIYSQAIKGSQYMHIAKELEVHAAEELQHALKIAKHIDYLGGDITATPKPVKLSDDTREMLRFDLEILPAWKGVPDRDRYLLLLPLIALLWPAVLYFHGLYQIRRGRSRLTRSRGAERASEMRDGVNHRERRRDHR